MTALCHLMVSGKMHVMISMGGFVQNPPSDNPYYTLAKKRTFPLRPSTPVYENGTAYTRDSSDAPSGGMSLHMLPVYTAAVKTSA